MLRTKRVSPSNTYTKLELQGYYVHRINLINADTGVIGKVGGVIRGFNYQALELARSLDGVNGTTSTEYTIMENTYARWTNDGTRKAVIRATATFIFDSGSTSGRVSIANNLTGTELVATYSGTPAGLRVVSVEIGADVLNSVGYLNYLIVKTKGDGSIAPTVYAVFINYDT